MKKIGIYNESGEDVPYLTTVKKVIKKAMEMEEIDAELNIIIVDDNYIWKLNKDYRHIDRPTDVISFALEDTEDVTVYEERVLGDIYICLDKVHEQAKEYGHTEIREMAFLIVHGLLHLLGYDHMKPDEEKVMFGKQDKILEELEITR